MATNHEFDKQKFEQWQQELNENPKADQSTWLSTHLDNDVICRSLLERILVTWEAVAARTRQEMTNSEMPASEQMMAFLDKLSDTGEAIKSLSQQTDGGTVNDLHLVQYQLQDLHDAIFDADAPPKCQ